MSKLVQSQQLQLAPEQTILESAVLEILRRPMEQAISFKEIAWELSRYDRIEIERSLLALAEQGPVEIAYTNGYGVGFRARITARQSLEEPDGAQDGTL